MKKFGLEDHYIWLIFIYMLCGTAGCLLLEDGIRYGSAGFISFGIASLVAAYMAVRELFGFLP